MNSIKLCPNLPEDIWYKILSEISLSRYPQIHIVNSMFHNIYKEVLSIQISKSIFDDIFNKAYYETLINSGDIRVYAVNYNVLRIMSGMGGLAYAN